MNHYQPLQQQSHQNRQMGSGLTRYRSAPSSYFAALLNNTTTDGGFGADDFEQLFNPRASIQQNCSTNSTAQSQLNSHFLPPRKHETVAKKPPQPLRRRRRKDDNSSSVSQIMSQSQIHNSANSGLIRQSSSPAGLFADINVESAILPPISEIVTQEIGEISSVDQQFDDFLFDDFLKELAEDDEKTFSRTNASDDQNNEGGNPPTTRLSHHLSLPTNFDVEKLLQDSVPFKTRAKRGCATHPRSIAERVRRTKISERMRKLQELVPNMEKQTHTADMLDLAGDYIKDLQRQIKRLEDNRAKCSCSVKKESYIEET